SRCDSRSFTTLSLRDGPVAASVAPVTPQPRYDAYHDRWIASVCRGGPSAMSPGQLRLCCATTTFDHLTVEAYPTDATSEKRYGSSVEGFNGCIGGNRGLCHVRGTRGRTLQ